MAGDRVGREPSSLRTPLSPVGGARASYHLAAHLQPGRSAGMAGSQLLRLALALLLLVRPRDSSVVLVVTGKLVEGNGVTPGDSGAGGTGLRPSLPRQKQGWYRPLRDI